MNSSLSFVVLVTSLIALPLNSLVTGRTIQDTSVVTLGDASLTAGIPGGGDLTAQQITQWLSDKNNHVELKIILPKGLEAGKSNLSIPSNNPMTRAKIELGRQLYFDPRLSSDSTTSCASCHAPDQGFAAHTPFGIGVDGQQGGRNSPVAYNRILSKSQFWDGRAGSLEEQAVGPIANPIEMGNTHDRCVVTLARIAGYRMQFEKIFADGVTIDNVGKAIASFERTIVTGPAPFDYFQAVVKFETGMGEEMEFLDEEPELKKQYHALKSDAAAHPMSKAAIRGMGLALDKARCVVCHSGANFSDEQYYNLGIGMDAATPDLGRFEISNAEIDRGAFKVPTLRNVVRSAPYMHDGSQATLEEVVEWYDKGGHPNPWISNKFNPLNLTDQEKADLVAFLKEGLTSEFPVIETGRLPLSP